MTKKLSYPDNLVKDILGEVIQIDDKTLSRLEEKAFYTHEADNPIGTYVKLYYKDGLTYRAIAQERNVNVSEPTIAKRIHGRIWWLKDHQVPYIFQGNELTTEYGMELRRKEHQAKYDAFCQKLNYFQRYVKEVVDFYSKDPDFYDYAVAAYKCEHPDAVVPISVKAHYVANLDENRTFHFTTEEEQNA